MIAFLAQMEPEVNWSATMKFILGLVGMLSILWLVFSVAIAWKKLFGRKPPLTEELEKLENKIHLQIVETYGRAYKNSEEAKAMTNDLRADMEKRFEDLNQERARTLDGINRAFRDFERGLGRLEGKTE